jgi:phenylacetate-CoA ligase
VPTTLDAELEEQKRWLPRPPYAAWTIFDRLVRNEFLPPDEQKARLEERVQRLLDFVAVAVPYYRRSLSRAGAGLARLRGVERLQTLPVLTRKEVQAHLVELGSTFLPPGENIQCTVGTSGSTGQPLRIDHTWRSRVMFCSLKQRELRWFRYDRMGKLAVIRSAADLPRTVGAAIPDDMPRQFDYWPQVGYFFETGPVVGLALSLPQERQLAWLEEEQPDYLMSLAANIEHLAFGFQARRPNVRLRGLEAISMQVTPSMRRFIEQAFGAPLHENYGLNEIGIVASRCPEGGRFHVHSECALVEIVNDDGRPCRPGERGHILVTGLANLAVPLLRYDTGDLADVLEGPCPCGRTLPSFGAIQGRYRRIAFLPAGTWERWMSLREAIVQAPPELLAGMRQFQLHQFRDGRCELRLVMAGEIPEGLLQRLRAAWPAADAPLHIVKVDSIPLPRGGKFQDFTSDFFPPPDEETSPLASV